ncbi:hypothetical protein [Kribbella sp. CA-293567]|uniref:hypothetical protein n=1 Tax=Kribbella sp. CA-293567 TaxID=3002436 RepID=UPI0022DE415D|nr:hypothetical protein [Kribbella sp. CA-293567]WBQ04441.1 hypothetical protein OX958_31315 [Kribbella sp. CA-293567]
MTTARSGGDLAAPAEGTALGVATVALILTLVLLLICFSIGAALLGQTSLAAIAGTGAVGLAGEIVRRVLTSAARPAEQAPMSPLDPERPDVG